MREERVFLEFLWSRRCSCRCGRCEACFQSFNGGHPRVAEHCEDRDCKEHCESQRDVHGGERRGRRPVREGFPSANKNERNEEVEVFMRETMSEGAVKRRWLENDHVRVKGAWNRNRRSMTVAWLLERS